MRSVRASRARRRPAARTPTCRPARAPSARTSCVSRRKSPCRRQRRRVAAVGHRDPAVGHLPAGEALLQRLADEPLHLGKEHLGRLEHVERDESRLHVGAERRPRTQTAPGSIRSASVAVNGFVLSGELRPVMFVWVLAWMTSSASPTPAGRSMHTVVVSRKSAAMPYSRSSVAWMTSFCTSP